MIKVILRNAQCNNKDSVHPAGFIWNKKGLTLQRIEFRNLMINLKQKSTIINIRNEKLQRFKVNMRAQ